jgi:hypothetical protein
MYGLHRFYSKEPVDPSIAMDVAQILSADILAYVISMGVDPGWIQEMVKADENVTGDRSKFNNLPSERLKALRVVTSTSKHSTSTGSSSGCPDDNKLPPPGWNPWAK